METYDVICPVCGKMNHSLYLEDTDGWMECERCLNITRYSQDDHRQQIPIMAVRSLRRQALPAR